MGRAPHHPQGLLVPGLGHVLVKDLLNPLRLLPLVPGPRNAHRPLSPLAALRLRHLGQQPPLPGGARAHRDGRKVDAGGGQTP